MKDEQAATSTQRRYAIAEDVLRSNIETGTLPPGLVLLEGPIADILQTSRAPVQRALQTLEAEGLVHRFSGRGFLVGPPGAAIEPNRTDIKALGNGSIAVTSQQNAIGRNRWEQTLTIAYRNGDFVVAGYTYNYYDTLDPDAAGKCDYNVLTGKAMVNDKPAKVAPRTIKIQDWDEEKDRGPCPTG